MAQEIYCDENGFSGNNLLNDDQTYFVYSSVAIQNEEADALVKQTFKDYKLQGNEIKGKNLLKFNNGRKALEFIIRQIASKTHLVCHDKKYALAGKFYEYTFEPLLAQRSSFFYEIGFNKYISSLLYFSFLCNKKILGFVLDDFQGLMRQTTPSDLRHPFNKERLKDLPPGVQEVLELCLHHKEEILKEISSLKEPPFATKWVLDLTQTSLFGLLSQWAQRYDVLDVYCDKSKPLLENPELFHVMIDRTDKQYIRIGEKELSLTFNLKRDIQCVKSEDYPGIQLADAMAAIWAFIMNNPRDEWAMQMMPRLTNSIGEFNVVPETRNMNMNNDKCIVNSLLLLELVDRSRQGKSLLHGLDFFIEELSQNLPLIKQDMILKGNIQ